ncbi:TIGR03759 family integrating conjugative element protein [Erwinia amylovora]|uniref:TIGR03759 family integrating conjugative element protein n=1 Tax=Erwinia amylovora TaxID=552 RepID=UPI001F04DCD7|nr:TIGR03759 family integrating conjugative element protein [Erwinia amylovora]
MKKTLLAGLVLLPLWATAATVQTPASQSSISPLQESASAQQNSQLQAQQWGLSDNEWSRYQALMKGARGIMSPGLDPLTSLGVESDSSADRRRLAELWVKHEYQRSEKELAFQREVNAAWLRLYPETLAVNMGSNAAGIAHDSRGRLALFVKEACSRCDVRLAAVLADNRPVDIYLVGGNCVSREPEICHYRRAAEFHLQGVYHPAAADYLLRLAAIADGDTRCRIYQPLIYRACGDGRGCEGGAPDTAYVALAVCDGVPV